MKKHIAITLSIIFTSCVSLNIADNKDLTTSRVYENLDTSKQELFVKCNEWMVNQFISSKSVIQYSDKEAGIIKGIYHNTNYDEVIHLDGPPSAKFLITIKVKDNRAKLSIAARGEILGSSKGLLNLKRSIGRMLQSFDKAIRGKNENW